MNRTISWEQFERMRALKVAEENKAKNLKASYLSLKKERDLYSTAFFICLSLLLVGIFCTFAIGI